MRAILAAKATTTMLLCDRARSPRNQMPIAVAVLLSTGIAALAPWISILRRYLLPRFVIPRSFGLPPVVACLGTNPSQAAKSRPRRKALASPTAETKAVALIGPIPGTVASRRGHTHPPNA